MTDKITLNNVADLTQTTTAQTTINNNFAVIQTAFDNNLSRDGTTPNTMGNNLDMNSFQVLNLPAPATADSPVRLTDLNTFAGGGTINTLPAGGTTGQVLDKVNNTSYNVQWTSSPQLSSITNSSGTLNINSSGTVTIPNVTDTVTTNAATQTLTNKTLSAPIIDVIEKSSPLTILTVGGGSAQSTYTNAALIGGSYTITTPPSSGQIAFNQTTNPTYLQAGSPSAPITITLPSAATDTIIARNSVDTLTNKTIASGSNTITGLGVSQLGGFTGSPTSSTFARGDGTWAVPSTGAMQLLETLSPSGVASISTSASWSGFSSIEVWVEALVPSSASAVTGRMQLTIGGTLQTTSYSTVLMQASTSATGSGGSGSQAFIDLSLAEPTSAIAAGISAKYTINNITGTTRCNIIGHGGYLITTGGSGRVFTIYGTYTGTTAAISGATFSFSTGNIGSGIIKIYGIV